MAEGGVPDYLKPCDLYSIKKSVKGDSITIVFTRKKVKTFSTFEDIIFKLYDKNLFLDYHYNEKQGKHNGIRYTFEIINGVEVNLTLYKSTQSLWIQGKGCERWFNESFSNLGKQLHEVLRERFQSQMSTTSSTSVSFEQDGQRQQHQQQSHMPLTSTVLPEPPKPSTSRASKPLEIPTEQQPGSEPLVSLKEFQTQFAVPKGIFPHTTILLYKYSSNATTKFKDMPEDTWQRIDNDPRAKDRNHEGEHAESMMIKRLTEIQEDLKEQTDYKGGSYKGIHTINVILNYSPCNKDPHFCSTRLCEFKTRLEEDIRSAVEVSKDTTAETADDDSHSALTEKLTNLNIEGKVKEEVKIEMNIHFSNFYRVNDLKNEEGLKSLCQMGIKLDVLTGKKWIYFYKAIGFELPEGREGLEKDYKAKFLNIMQTR